MGEDLFADKLAKLLSSMDIHATAQGRIVKPGPGTPVIAIEGVDFTKPQPALWIAHAKIRFSLNPDRPETNVDDCAVGWAATQERAVEIAAEAWTKVTAPAVFSFLRCSPILGADWYPMGDEAGLPGWFVFAGPYGFRGDPEGHQSLEGQLRQQPLLPALASEILRGFRRPYFNYIKLYRCYSGSGWLGEASINGTRCQGLTDALLALEWPKLAEFASATLFAVAYAQVKS
jgi:hypothetical protein